MKKFAGTYIALAVLVALGAYILFVEGIKPPEKNGEKVILEVPADDITHLAIEQAGGVVELERSADGEWAITAPRRVAASQAAVKGVVDTLAKLKCEKKVQEKADDLGAFGLDSPEVRVTATTKRGRKTVLVGAMTPVGSARYVKLGESDPIYVLGSSVVTALQKSLDDLREREIFRMASSSVTGLRILRAGGAEMRLEKKADDEWRIAHPFDDEADRWRVNDLIWDLTGLEAQKFVDEEGKDLSRWGLDHPRLRVDAISSERSSPLHLFVGAPGPDGKGFYVRTSESASVYLVNPAAFSPLEASPLDLIKKDIVTWNDDDLLRVTCEDRGKAAAFLREGKGWKSVLPDQSIGTAGTSLSKAPAAGTPEVVKEGEKWTVKGAAKTFSQEDMEKLWTALRDIKVVDVADGAVAGVGEAGYGLARPRIRVELDLGDGKVVELKVGSKAQEGYYAVVTGRNLVYLVDEQKVQALESEIQALSR